MQFVLQRVSSAIVSFLLIAVFAFFLLHLIPGDAVDIILGENAPPAAKAELRSSLGLDQPWLTQLWQFLSRLPRGDFGTSSFTGESAFSRFAERFPKTAQLTLMSLALAWLVALPLGTLVAVRRSRALDELFLVVTTLGVSLPAVILGPILVQIFALHLRWLPVSGADEFSAIILPALSLAIPLGSVMARFCFAQVRDTLSEDFVRTARAKGLRPLQLYGRHVLRAALIPLITISGLQIAGLLTGTVVTEILFDWPGIGSLLYQAILQRDLTLVRAGILFSAAVYMAVSLMSDLAYLAADPRLRRTG